MTTRFLVTCLMASACGYAPALSAQSTTPPPSASSGGALEQALAWADSKVDDGAQVKDGFYPELGGFINGAGVSIGPGFRHHLFGDQMLVDVSAAVSWRRYTMMQSRIEWPRLMSGRLVVGGSAKYQDFTQINFFGVGSDSQKGSQTDYRLTSVDASGFATLRANSWLSVSGSAGLLRHVQIGPGTSSLLRPTGDVFDATAAPGLMSAPTYLHTEVAVEADTRDAPGYPSSGGRYRLSVASFHDRTLGRYSFDRIEAEAAQYLTLFAPRSVLALRARLDATVTAPGQSVAFYLLPALGGSRSLRGYLDYRFRDRDLVLFDGEYRFPILRAVDGAAFYDAGTVAPTIGGLTAGPLITDYGIGLRVHSRKNLLFRVDFARGRDGSRVVASFSPAFGVSHSIVPFVP